MDRQAEDLLRQPYEGQDRDEADALAAFIGSLVEAGPVLAKDAERRVREAFGAVPKASMYRARKRAGVQDS